MIGRIFMRGFFAIAPIALTLALVIWLFTVLERFFGFLIEEGLGTQYYFPGVGLLLALGLIFAVGTFINFWLVSALYALGERVLQQIPLVKTLYASVCDLLGFFSSGDFSQKGKVVTVEVFGGRLIGLVTREDFEDLPAGIGREGEIAVYLPFSYQIGGFTVMVSKDKVHPVDASFEQGMRFAATAGMPGRGKLNHTAEKKK